MRALLKIAAAVVGLCFLTGGSCATTSGPRVVNLPVARSCVPKALPATPAGLETRESLVGASDDAELLKRLYADWKVRAARMLETEPVIAACR